MKLSDVLFRELVSHGHIQSQPNGNIQITNNNFVLPQLILSQQLFYTSKDTFTKYLYPNWYIHHICTPRDTFTKYFLHKLIHSPHVYLNWYIHHMCTSIDTFKFTHICLPQLIQSPHLCLPQLIHTPNIITPNPPNRWTRLLYRVK